jgi:hypothetical protein
VIGCVVLLTLALGLVTVPGAGDAQPAGKVYRVGFLGNSTATLEANLVGRFVRGCATSAGSRARTWRSSTAGRRVSTSGSRLSRRASSPTWAGRAGT